MPGTSASPRCRVCFPCSHGPGSCRVPGRLHAGVAVPWPVWRAGGLRPQGSEECRGAPARPPLALPARLAQAPREEGGLSSGREPCGRRGHGVPGGARTCGAGIVGNPLIRGWDTESHGEAGGVGTSPLERPQGLGFPPAPPWEVARAEGPWRPEPPCRSRERVSPRSPGPGFGRVALRAGAQPMPWPGPHAALCRRVTEQEEPWLGPS